MRSIEAEGDKLTFWQLVFSQSRANGAPYRGEQLPGHNWNWPTNTFLQRRLRQIKWYDPADNRELN